MFINVLSMLIGYVLGSIPFALLVGRFAKKADIRNHGSGNLGATNAVRVLGKKWGILVLLGDAGKGSLAILFAHLLGSSELLLVGLFAVLGHCFPLFAGFKGGKAIATTAGVLIAINPIFFLIVYIGFVLVVITTRYILLGSLSVGLSISIYLFITDGLLSFIWGMSYFLLLLFLHRSNIANLVQGNEPKINDKSLSSDRL